MTTQIRICRSTEFALDLNIGNKKLIEVNKIVALNGHCACAALKKIVDAASAHSGTIPLDWQKLTPQTAVPLA